MNPKISRIIYVDTLNKKISYVNPDNTTQHYVASVLAGDIITDLKSLNDIYSCIIDINEKTLRVFNVRHDLDWQSKLNSELVSRIEEEYKSDEVSMVYYCPFHFNITISKCRTKIKSKSFYNNFVKPTGDKKLQLNNEVFGYLIWHNDILMFIIK